MSGSFSSGLLDSLAHPAQVNYLDTVDKASKAALYINEARKTQAQQAWGNALQQATGPDGTTDYQKARAIAAQDPTAALGMMEGLKGAADLSGAQQTQGAKANSIFTNAITAALHSPPGQLAPAIHDQVEQLVATGAMTRQAANTALLNLPSDEGAARAELERKRISLLPPTMQQPAIYGQPLTTYGPTGNLIGGLQSPQTGAVTSPQAGGGIPTLEGSAPTQTGVTSTGAPRMGTRRQFVGAAEGGQPSGLPPSLRNPNAPGAAAAPASTGAPTPAAAPPTGGGGVVTGLGPAAQAAQEHTGAQAAEAFAAEPRNDQTAQTQLATLSNMQSDLGRFTSGTGAEKTLDFKRAVQSWAPGIATSFGIKSDAVSAQESFDKLANQIALTQANAGSDQRMATSLAANPHAGLSPEGADMIIRQLQGNADFIRAKAGLAAKYRDKSDYTGFQNSIAALDPRVFQYERMTPPQRHDWYSALPKDQKPQFQQSYAATHQLIGQPGG